MIGRSQWPGQQPRQCLRMDGGQIGEEVRGDVWTSLGEEMLYCEGGREGLRGD